jgi:hypothetical protein
MMIHWRHAHDLQVIFLREWWSLTSARCTRWARPHHRLPWLAPVLLGALFLGSEAGAATLPDAGREDVNFAAEHLLESDMDARYSALPLAGGQPKRGAWQPTVMLSAVDTGAGLYRLRGPSFGVGLARGVSQHWSLQVLGFFERSVIGGDDRNDLLRPEFSRDIPLDLPERADFEGARGDVKHWAAGLAVTRQAHRHGPQDGHWTWSFGALREPSRRATTQSATASPEARTQGSRVCST